MGGHRGPIEDLRFGKEELLTLPIDTHETIGLGIKIGDDGRLDGAAHLERVGVASGDHRIRCRGEFRLRVDQWPERPHPDILADGAFPGFGDPFGLAKIP